MAVGAKNSLVVVGLGVAGLKVAQKAVASGLFDVISVEPKEFFEIPFSAVRTAVTDDETYVDKTLIPYTSIPGGVGKHIRASATAITSKSVTLDNGQTLAYDYLVVSPGAKHSGQGVITSSVTTVAERKAQLKAFGEKVKAAKSIVVIGGGPVGIELVGEIVERYAGKAITLVHSGPRLLESKDVRLHQHIESLFKKHGVKLVVNDKAAQVDEAGHLVHTQGGLQLPAEVVVWAAGAKPNTAPLVAGGELAGLVNERGFAKVDPFLRLEGHPNIYVLGDSNDTPAGKLGFLADLQADLALANVIKTVNGQATKLAKYAPPLQPKGAMIVTFGKGDGVGHVGGCVCGPWFARSVKGGDLLVGKVRAGLGLKS